MFTFVKSRLTQCTAITVFTLALAVFSFSAPVKSSKGATTLPACASSTEYYSDSTYTTQVGGKATLCNGRTVRWGTITSYSINYIDGACAPQYEEICNG